MGPRQLYPKRSVLSEHFEERIEKVLVGRPCPFSSGTEFVAECAGGTSAARRNGILRALVMACAGVTAAARLNTALRGVVSWRGGGSSAACQFDFAYTCCAARTFTMVASRPRVFFFPFRGAAKPVKRWALWAPPTCTFMLPTVAAVDASRRLQKAPYPVGFGFF